MNPVFNASAFVPVASNSRICVYLCPSVVLVLLILRWGRPALKNLLGKLPGHLGLPTDNPDYTDTGNEIPQRQRRGIPQPRATPGQRPGKRAYKNATGLKGRANARRVERCAALQAADIPSHPYPGLAAWAKEDRPFGPHEFPGSWVASTSDSGRVLGP